MNWPDPPTGDFLPCPRRANDLLAHWEFLLWKRYRKAHEAGEMEKGCEGKISPWNEWLKAHTRVMWERLSTCTDLVRLCHTTPSRQLHQAITLLFLFSDMVERRTMEGVFGFRQPKEKDRLQQIKRRQKHAANLETARALVARTPLGGLSADERKTLDQLLAKGLQGAQRQAGPGPSALVFNLTAEGEEQTVVFAPEAPEAPAAFTTGRGKPVGTGGDLNMYLALLVDLLNESLHGQGHLKAALAMLHAFNPPQFQKNHTPWIEDNLRLTVHQFKDQGGHTGKQRAIATQLRALRAWLETPAVRELCPVPPFLLPTPSASVADTPR
jgi:hypothetical protein